MPDAPPPADLVRSCRTAILAERAITAYCAEHPGPSADWTDDQRDELARLRRELSNANAEVWQARRDGAGHHEEQAARAAARAELEGEQQAAA